MEIFDNPAVEPIAPTTVMTTNLKTTISVDIQQSTNTPTSTSMMDDEITTISVDIQQSTNSPTSTSIPMMNDDINTASTINSTDIGKVSKSLFLKLYSDWLSQIRQLTLVNLKPKWSIFLKKLMVISIGFKR